MTLSDIERRDGTLGPISTRDASIERISYGNVSVWVAGWLAVCHSRYCIKTTISILNFFDRLVTPS